ncbi:MAG: hypothetical protein JNK48_13840 [Bryobacterales bacterium]|nr:hypothetical protein [Bryobacterales bacterium]
MNGKLWPVAAGSFLAILGLAYGLRSGTQDRAMLANQHTLSVSLNQLQKQVADLSERLSALHALGENRALVIEPPGKGVRESKAKASDEVHWKAIQRQLAEQSQRLSVTQQELERARRDLASRLGATRDDLNGSIARTNEEVAQLRHRGQRDYHEFQLSKSKQFQRSGPLGLALRKTDAKRKRYDIDLLVDDVKVEKRNVSLYEPVSIRSGGQALELVVNEVGKDRVKGYVSAPKGLQARAGQ